MGLIGEESAGNYFSYHFDYRGSTIAITNITGQLVDSVQYSPFGVVLSQPIFDTPFLFNGLYGVMTDGNRLNYMRARYYSAEIRRFVNQDVLLGNVADGQSLNRFAFVTGNPVSFVDPFGLYQIDASCGIQKDFLETKTDKACKEIVRSIKDPVTLAEMNARCNKDSDIPIIRCNEGPCSMLAISCWVKQLFGGKCPKDLTPIGGTVVYICEDFFDSKKQFDEYIGEIVVHGFGHSCGWDKEHTQTGEGEKYEGMYFPDGRLPE